MLVAVGNVNQFRTSGEKTCDRFQHLVGFGLVFGLFVVVSEQQQQQHRRQQTNTSSKIDRRNTETILDQSANNLNK